MLCYFQLYIYTFINIDIFLFQVLFFYRLLQNIEYSSLCYTVGLCWIGLHELNKRFLAIKMEKAMAPHSSTLAWKIPWTEEPGRLQSMGSLRVGHD